MRFEPKTEEEIARESLFPEGEYDFEVIDAIDATSKSGNEMITLSLKLFVEDETRVIKDWLVAGSSRKIRQFCESTGIMDNYNKGQFYAADLPGLTGRCKIKFDKGGNGYDPSNKVAWYVKPEAEGYRPERAPADQPARPVTPSRPASDQSTEDDLPF